MLERHFKTRSRAAGYGIFSTELRLARSSVTMVLLIILIVLLGGVLIFAGYSFSWTGFGEKTLWDWMNLLIIPAALGLGALLFNQRQERREKQIALDQSREEKLQSYLDRMTELLLDKGLRESKAEDEVRTVATARTLTVLRGLDAVRKGFLVQFLALSQLINSGKDERPPIIDLRGAPLRQANLTFADLSGTNLSHTFLSGADLSQADLSGTNLTVADLTSANLSGADLSGTNLSSVNRKVSSIAPAI